MAVFESGQPRKMQDKCINLHSDDLEHLPYGNESTKSKAWRPNVREKQDRRMQGSVQNRKIQRCADRKKGQKL